jgi:hypothetical protein
MTDAERSGDAGCKLHCFDQFSDICRMSLNDRQRHGIGEAGRADTVTVERLM